MITLVRPSELGLYAVAVNIGSFGTMVTAGISPPLLARISAGEIELVPRALRTVLALLAASPLADRRSDAFLLRSCSARTSATRRPPPGCCWPRGCRFAGSEILTQALYGLGRPGLPAVGQPAALAITCPGCFWCCRMMGIVGAAIVSLVAYTVNFLILLVATVRMCELTVSSCWCRPGPTSSG